MDTVITRLQEQARAARSTASVLGAAEDLEPGEAQRLLSHPLPYWVEVMTSSYLRSAWCEARGANEKAMFAKVVGKEGSHNIWRLRWPDGFEQEGCFSHNTLRTAHLGLEEPRIRGLAMRLPRFAPGQPVPAVSIPGMADEIRGLWSLWQISVVTHEAGIAGRLEGPVTLDPGPEIRRRRIMPLFLADNGMVYRPTARHVWDQILTGNLPVRSALAATVSQAAFETLRNAAEEHGQPIYQALIQEHQARIAREREKASYAFAARRSTVTRIGLPQVRNYRLNLLAQEERSCQEQLDQKAHAWPEMTPLLVIRVEGGGHE